MKRKNGRGRGIESNRRLCASRRLSIFKNVALASLLAPIRRAPRLLDCVARITRRSRPPPIDIFHFLSSSPLKTASLKLFFVIDRPPTRRQERTKRIIPRAIISKPISRKTVYCERVGVRILEGCTSSREEPGRKRWSPMVRMGCRTG